VVITAKLKAQKKPRIISFQIIFIGFTEKTF
jgi:hypothetical protein